MEASTIDSIIRGEGSLSLQRAPKRPWIWFNGCVANTTTALTDKYRLTTDSRSVVTESISGLPQWAQESSSPYSIAKTSEHIRRPFEHLKMWRAPILPIPANIAEYKASKWSGLRDLSMSILHQRIHLHVSLVCFSFIMPLYVRTKTTSSTHQCLQTPLATKHSDEPPAWVTILENIKPSYVNDQQNIRLHPGKQLQYHKRNPAAQYTCNTPTTSTTIEPGHVHTPNQRYAFVDT